MTLSYHGPGGEPPRVTLKPRLAKVPDESRNNASAELALRRAVEVDLVGQIVDFVFADMTLDQCDGFCE